MGAEMSFLQNLTWRRAVKHFDEGEVKVDGIVKAIHNAPSSFGLQPYKVVVVTNKELKEKLKDASFGQSQVTECFALFIFCARTDVDARAEEYLKVTGRDNTLGPMLRGFIASLSDKVGWATKQAYIALGYGLAAATEEKIASCPMEGFVPSEVAKILGLEENLVPCVYLAVGKESSREDAVYPRFRFAVDDMFTLKE